MVSRPRGIRASASQLEPEADGADSLYGHRGDDIIEGGRGNDRLFGQRGDDTLDGGMGRDRLYGGPGSDTLTGGEGDDTFVLRVQAGEHDVITDYEAGERIVLKSTDWFLRFGLETFGDDLVVTASNGYRLTIQSSTGVPDFDLADLRVDWNMSEAESGVTRSFRKHEDLGSLHFFGSAHPDFINATSGDDILRGADGDDVLSGNKGHDILEGGRGSDDLFGGSGDDILDGGQDQDLVSGGWGNDTLTGGEGDDTFYLHVRAGEHDVITDHEAGDHIVLRLADPSVTFGRRRPGTISSSRLRTATS